MKTSEPCAFHLAARGLQTPQSAGGPVILLTTHLATHSRLPCIEGCHVLRLAGLTRLSNSPEPRTVSICSKGRDLTFFNADTFAPTGAMKLLPTHFRRGRIHRIPRVCVIARDGTQPAYTLKQRLPLDVVFIRAGFKRRIGSPQIGDDLQFDPHDFPHRGGHVK